MKITPAMRLVLQKLVEGYWIKSQSETGSRMYAITPPYYIHADAGPQIIYKNKSVIDKLKAEGLIALGRLEITDKGREVLKGTA